MADQDLNHAQGNVTCQDMLNQMSPKDNTGSDKYARGDKGPKISTVKTVLDGWSK